MESLLGGVNNEDKSKAQMMMIVGILRKLKIPPEEFVKEAFSKKGLEENTKYLGEMTMVAVKMTLEELEEKMKKGDEKDSTITSKLKEFFLKKK